MTQLSDSMIVETIKRLGVTHIDAPKYSYTRLGSGVADIA